MSGREAPPAPQDLDAEESVLGAMMLSAHAIDAAIDEGLIDGDFYRATNGVIFAAVMTLYRENLAADAITVADRLAEQGKLVEVGGKARIHEIATLVASTSNAGHYARIVHDQALLRGLIVTGTEITKLGWDRQAPAPELVEQAERLLFDLALSRQTQEVVVLEQALAESFALLEAAHARGKTITGISSGFPVIDALTAGFQPGNLIVVAARPSMGKSAWALNVAEHVATQKIPVAFFTMEMSRAEVTQRIVSAEAFVPSDKLRNGQMSSKEWSDVMSAHTRLANAPLLIDDTHTLTATELRSKARRLKIRYPKLGLVIVDYLQLMTSGSSFDNRTQDVSQTSRALKILAAELDVPVIAVSQVSRGVEQRHDKRPMLSDLRESGQIEADADLVLFVYRDEVYNPEDAAEIGTEGIAEFNLAKHRNGAIGTVKLAFVKRFAKFSNLEVNRA